MVATVRCYYNTGLTPNNCMDSLSRLDRLGFEYKDFPNIAIKQDRGLVSIKINTIYDDIKDADYCKINNIGYWVTSINMANDNVAVVNIQQDYLTTIGVNGFEIISGWCKRRSVRNDSRFDNTLDEPFTPVDVLKLDFGSEIKPNETQGEVGVVVASVDLLNLEKVAETYEDQSANLKVAVPQLPFTFGDSTTYTMNIDGENKSTFIPMTSAFKIGNSEVQKGLKLIRSLGVESAIVASYIAPSEYINVNVNEKGLITGLTGKHTIVNSTLLPYWDKKDGTKYKNAKVFSGQFQKYVLASIVSGDTSEYRPEDIIESLVSDLYIIKWVLDADPSYNGYPVCKPNYFHSSLNKYWVSTVKGAKWRNAPIAFNSASGDLISSFNFNREENAMLEKLAMSIGLGLASNIGHSSTISYDPGTGTNVLPGPSNSLPGSPINSMYPSYSINTRNLSWLGNIPGVNNITSFIGQGVNSRIALNQLRASFLNQVRPQQTIFGSQIPNLHSYIGNYFYEYRYRLSDEDMIRFDNFLTQFGYAVNEPLKKDCFFGRTKFNYIECENVNIKTQFPVYMRDGLINQLQAGIRVWHDKPTIDAMYDNPIDYNGSVEEDI